MASNGPPKWIEEYGKPVPALMAGTAKVLMTVLAATLAVVLGLASVPWMVCVLGRAVLGDEAGADRATEASPFFRYLSWIEARHAA